MTILGITLWQVEAIAENALSILSILLNSSVVTYKMYIFVQLYYM